MGGRTAGMWQKSIRAVPNGRDKEVLIDVSDLQYFSLQIRADSGCVVVDFTQSRGEANC